MKNQKNNARRFIISLFMLLVLVVSATVSVFAKTPSYFMEVPNHTNEFYVNDFANLFTEIQKEEMVARAKEFDELTGGIQVVISTIESLEGATIEKYSYAMFSQYGIGKDDMGILVLFSTGDRAVKIETGQMMQTYITDSMSGALLDDYGMDYFVNDKFAEGLISVQKAIISKLKEINPTDWKTSEVAEEDISTVIHDVESKDTVNVLYILILVISLLFNAALIILFLNEKKKRISEENLQKENNVKFTEKVKKLTEHYELNTKELSSALKIAEQELKNQKNKAIEECVQYESEIATLTDKYHRIQALHPEFNFESEIEEMIVNERKSAAEQINTLINEASITKADKDKIHYFENAIQVYENASDKIKPYISVDIIKVRRLLDESIGLQKAFEKAEQEKKDRKAAEEAYQRISEICERYPVGNHLTYEWLKEAHAIYMGLSSAEKAFLPDDDVIYNFKESFKLAKEDYENFSKAQNAQKDIHNIIDRIHTADENDMDSIERAMRIYARLSSFQRTYFDDSLIHRCNALRNQAHRDHEEQERRRRIRRQEEEERRRRQSQNRMNSSSSTRRSSSSISRGHGGRPSGGGASRRF